MRSVALIAAVAAMLPAAAKADCAVKSAEFCGSALAGDQDALAQVEEPYVVPHFFAIRKNVDDLRYSQDSDEFKKVERASVSFKQDYEADSASFAIDGSHSHPSRIRSLKSRAPRSRQVPSTSTASLEPPFL